LVDARDLAIPAGQRSEVLISTVPANARTVEARLAGSDALATDDRAFAIVPAEETARALLVGDGSAYLENALALLPRLELYAVGGDGYTDALAEAETDATPYGVFIFDGVVPAEPPPGAALYVDPATDGAFGSVAGRVEGPTIDRTDPDEPLLRFVDLGSVHVGRARQIEAAEGLRALVSTTGGDPLVAIGEHEGRRHGVIAFDLGESDLPLQIAFPLLMSNIVDYLLPAAGGLLPSSMPLGESLTLTVDPSIERVSVSADGPGAPVELSVAGGQLTLPGAETVGLREIRAISDDPALDGLEMGRTAVNLFSADESDVAPGDPQRIMEMGRVTTDEDGPAQPTRAEWWWPLALSALGLLALEWLLFHRPTRRTLRRAFGRRPQPLGGRVP
jgi:hypothetical protein